MIVLKIIFLVFLYLILTYSVSTAWYYFRQFCVYKFYLKTRMSFKDYLYYHNEFITYFNYSKIHENVMESIFDAISSFRDSFLGIVFLNSAALISEEEVYDNKNKKIKYENVFRYTNTYLAFLLPALILLNIIGIICVFLYNFPIVFKRIVTKIFIPDLEFLTNDTFKIYSGNNKYYDIISKEQDGFTITPNERFYMILNGERITCEIEETYKIDV